MNNYWLFSTLLFYSNVKSSEARLNTRFLFALEIKTFFSSVNAVFVGAWRSGRVVWGVARCSWWRRRCSRRPWQRTPTRTAGLTRCPPAPTATSTCPARRPLVRRAASATDRRSDSWPSGRRPPARPEDSRRAARRADSRRAARRADSRRAARRADSRLAARRADSRLVARRADSRLAARRADSLAADRRTRTRLDRGER